ncbi:dolichyl-diphosphooligosaccharide--protein glycosyltransferase subunit 1 [Polyrhizophydium stewartii]|uniref:Dolichyl-diphosphooligosaccharide--protein glycosyltransferase subunit 1 n=1 Tax=Polyrhizophydium stewartii TaxID=2732419 RepID=A0ABR4NEI2_9FUNG
MRVLAVALVALASAVRATVSAGAGAGAPAAVSTPEVAADTAAAAAAAAAIVGGDRPSLVPPASIPQAFVLETVANKIDLSRTIVRQETTVVARAVDSAAASVFYVAQPLAAVQDFLALLDVRLRDQDGLALEVSKAAVADGIQYYAVKLPAAPAPGGKTTLFIKSVFVGLLHPYPRRIPQLATQNYEFFGNAYFLTPYNSLQQTTTVKLPNARDVKSHTKGPAPVDKRSDGIVYGPYTEVAPLTQSKLYVHFGNSKAILVAKHFSKLAEVSHWGGNLAVQEDYEVHHRGAELKGQFSRIDYKLSVYGHEKTSVVKGLTAVLPAGAKDVFYRDVIGNVSTSRFRNERDQSVLYLQPRFPLYGGWRYTWFQGYSVAVSSLLKTDTKSGRYVLQLPFKSSISDLTVEDAELKVVLPEGATDIQVDASIPVDSVAHSMTFTYLDSTGRPTVVIKKSKMVDDHNGVVQITYSYSTLRLLQKPLVVAAYVFAFFAVLMVYSRTDLSITKDAAKDSEERLETFRGAVAQAVAPADQAHAQVEFDFEAFKETRNAATFRHAQARHDQAVASAAKQLGEISLKSAAVSKPYATSVAGLSSLVLERAKIVRSLQDEVEAFNKDARNAADPARKKALVAQIDKMKAQIREMSSKIADAVGVLGD